MRCYSLKAFARYVTQSIIRNKRGVRGGVSTIHHSILIHANRNLGLADEDGSANIVEILQIYSYVTCQMFQLITSQSGLTVV